MNKRMNIIVFGLIFYTTGIFAITFEQAQKRVLEHDTLSQTNLKAQAMEHKAKVAGAWGDPMLSVSALNLPVDRGLRRDLSPMTGVMFGLSQKIPLGARLSNKEGAGLARARSAHFQSEYEEQRLLAEFWMVLVNLKRHGNDLVFLRENASWLSAMVQVSKRLYANGKISQQALLDIQIRHNQVKSQIKEKEALVEEFKQRQTFLIGEAKILSDESIPWSFLHKQNDRQDLKEQTLDAAVQAASMELKAMRWARLPEMTVGVNYVKRNELDRLGDFVGVSVSIPLPIGTTRSSGQEDAALQWMAAQAQLRSYQKERTTTLATFDENITSLAERLKLIEQSLDFAKTAREVTSKSYRLGALSYFDLLQSELRLQEMQLKLNELKAMQHHLLIQKKLWLGDMLVTL